MKMDMNILAGTARLEKPRGGDATGLANLRGMFLKIKTNPVAVSKTNPVPVFHYRKKKNRYKPSKIVDFREGLERVCWQTGVTQAVTPEDYVLKLHEDGVLFGTNLTLRVCMFNVRSLRNYLKKCPKAKIWKESFDVLVLTEVQADLISLDKFPEFHEMCSRYKLTVINSCKENLGYAGVLILTKRAPEQIKFGCGAICDDEGRTITLVYRDVILIGVYSPCYRPGDEASRAKREDYETTLNQHVLRERKKHLNPNVRVVLCGDLNVAPTEADRAPAEQRIWGDSAGTNLERATLTRLMETNHLKDCATDNVYTWYPTQIRRAKMQNIGMRIDLLLCSKDIRVVLYQVLTRVPGSDHQPVVAQISKMPEHVGIALEDTVDPLVSADAKALRLFNVVLPPRKVFTDGEEANLVSAFATLLLEDPSEECENLELTVNGMEQPRAYTENESHYAETWTLHENIAQGKVTVENTRQAYLRYLLFCGELPVGSELRLATSTTTPTLLRKTVGRTYTKS